MRKKQHRYADIGFGGGELIRKFAREGRSISGVEKRQSERIEISNAQLTYDGLRSWLRRAPRDHFSVINFGFIFNNIGHAEESNSMVSILTRVKSKLVPGGRVRIVCLEDDVGKYRDHLEDAGFIRITQKLLDSKNLSTRAERWWYKQGKKTKYIRVDPWSVTARRPRTKKT